eukprot:1717054-Rhodomonas_salina.2
MDATARSVVVVATMSPYPAFVRDACVSTRHSYQIPYAHTRRCPVLTYRRHGSDGPVEASDPFVKIALRLAQPDAISVPDTA